MATYDRDELEAFYAKHRALHEAADWVGIGDLFTDDGAYFDAYWGWNQGVADIKKFLHDSMQGLDDWEFPIEFALMEGDRIVTHWYNRLPGARDDGTFYETPGVSIITYAGHGKMSRQMDLYDTKAIVAVMKEHAEANPT